MTTAIALDRLVTLHIPGAATIDDYGQSQPGPVTDVKVWARRIDLTGRGIEQLEVENTQRLNIHRTFIVIRHRADVEAGQELTDDAGQKRRIIGLAELGRGRYIELLAERIE